MIKKQPKWKETAYQLFLSVTLNGLACKQRQDQMEEEEVGNGSLSVGGGRVGLTMLLCERASTIQLSALEQYSNSDSRALSLRS